MATLRLLESGGGAKGHGGEVFAVAYGPDSAAVLTGGWDGHLRLWGADGGKELRDLRASAKPITACAVSPDGALWLSGSLDGLLSRWDATTDEQVSSFAPHARPLSALVFGPDGVTLATASWDRHLILWDLTRDRQGRTLTGHQDIVAGCQFLPNGRTLLSWSHDGTLRLWDVATARPRPGLSGHTDRVTAGAVSPDGRWAASGARDGSLKLWELALARETAARHLPGEVRACCFLLDGTALAAVDARGRITLHALPGLEEQLALPTDLPVQCAELAPSGAQIALGCADGQLRLVAVEGFDRSPLLVTALPTARRNPSLFQRLLGRSEPVQVYACVCPVCRHVQELTAGDGQVLACPRCQRRLDVHFATPPER